MKSGIMVTLGLACMSAAAAQTIDTTVMASGVKTNAFTLSGYIEAYYVYDLTAPKTAQERPGFLYNHKRNREVNINLAYLKGSYSGERIRGNFALQAGTYPQYNYAGEQELVKTIYKANVGVKLSRTQDLWFDAGIFPSHIGFESAISKDCWTLTRSLMAENSPYYLSGAKLTYNSPNRKWTLLGMATNGWQRVRKLPGYSGMAVSTQVQYRPSANVTLNWSSFLGSDRPDTLRQGRFFNNFYAILTLADRFGLTLGFDLGADHKPVVATGDTTRVDGGGSYRWFSPVVIARYQTSGRSHLAGRVEYYDDKNGVIMGTAGFQTMGYSLGYDYVLFSSQNTGSALFRIEGKAYQSQTSIFASDNGAKRVNLSITTSLAISF
ncbi:porin [Larkinella bovis]|uniref:Porin n=1 Tax=Larkinella bovis TaxID=683041 RepID=A0ABW0I5A5_9BACT